MAGVITGKHMLYDVSLTVNSVDLSNHVQSVALTVSQESFPADAMGDTQRYKKPGLQVIDDITITFFQDFAGASVYPTLYAAFSTPQTTFNLVAKASTAANSATNPQWTIPCMLAKAPIISGAHGAAHMVQATFTCSGSYSVATS